MISKVSLVSALAAQLALVAGLNSKPLIQPAFEYWSMETTLRENLHPMHSNWDYWGQGWIPKLCKDFATSNRLSPYDFTVFNVHYDDCSEAWTFCRHKDAQGSEMDMIDLFGRLPVHMRSYIRYVMSRTINY